MRAYQGDTKDFRTGTKSVRFDDEDYKPLREIGRVVPDKIEEPQVLTMDNVLSWLPCALSINAARKFTEYTKIITKAKKIIKNGKIKKDGEVPEGNQRWWVEYRGKRIYVYYSKRHDVYLCECSAEETQPNKAPKCEHVLAAMIEGKLNEKRTVQKS